MKNSLTGENNPFCHGCLAGRLFFLYTYGVKKEGYTQAIREAAEGRGARIVGEYGCFGFNTFGPFKLIGGLAKGHPDQEEIKNAVAFFEKISK